MGRGIPAVKLRTEQVGGPLLDECSPRHFYVWLAVVACVMHCRAVRAVFCLAVAMTLVFFSPGFGAERIRLLLLVQDSRVDALRMFFDGEPSVEYKVIVTWDGRVPDSELVKLIRLYFPRRYQEMTSYDVLILCKPNYELITPKQDMWIRDAIWDGSGGMNDGSVFSQIAGVPQAWASGVAWEAFPNDAPAVTARYSAWAQIESHWVQINKNHPEPILTAFVPFGVENARGGLSRLVIARDGSGVLAWQGGNYPQKEPYLVAWWYGKGRAMTIGSPFPGGWLAYPTGVTGENKYSPEIVMNMIFWLANTELIDDVEVFHRVKSDFAEFVTRMRVLISLKDFIDKFGANTESIEREMIPLEEIYAEATHRYLEHAFLESQASISSALVRFPAAEEVARREKNKALLWVFLIEWLVTSSALFMSGSVLWMLMIRRKLYRKVEMTRLAAAKE